MSHLHNIEFPQDPTFFQQHKTKIAVAATAVVCLMINRLSHKSKDEFLKEHDLYEEYYTPTDEEMGY